MKRVVIALTLLLAAPFAESDVDETRATLRAYVLDLINRDRARYDLPPVALDLHASAMGDEYCRTQIRNGTTGHFTIDGIPPYARYSFAGGNDAVRENAAAWSAPYAFNERALVEMAGRSQDAMMAEMPPNDGHKKTVLDPHATHVGIGLAWEGGEFRLVQEFVRRYIDWTRPLPRDAHLHQRVTMSGRALRGTRVDSITVHHEPLPRPMTARAASAIDTYALPHERREYVPRRGRDHGAFSFTVPFTEGPGLYTIVVWVKKDGGPAFAASNVSIRVDGELHNGRAAAAGR